MTLVVCLASNRSLNFEFDEERKVENKLDQRDVGQSKFNWISLIAVIFRSFPLILLTIAITSNTRRTSNTNYGKDNDSTLYPLRWLHCQPLTPVSFNLERYISPSSSSSSSSHLPPFLSLHLSSTRINQRVAEILLRQLPAQLLYVSVLIKFLPLPVMMIHKDES